MAQDWVADLYTTGTVGHTTLSNMELMFATLRSSFSGATGPASPVDGNLWYDSSAKELLKVYRNGAWAGVLCGSVSLKLWLYLNAAEDGWAIDATVTDRVLALKGGSTYTTGAANAGSWTISGIQNESAHTHPADSNYVDGWIDQGSGSNDCVGYHKHTITVSAGSAHSHSHDGSWRISAAVGTLQYPNI
jgi:hypothetical protein